MLNFGNKNQQFNISYVGKNPFGLLLNPFRINGSVV